MKRAFLFTFLFGAMSFCAFAQTAVTLDDAIQDSADFFSARLPSRATIAVTNFEAETKELSDFIIQELMDALANTGNVRIVERSRLEMLQSELDFNMSGAVSDETAQSIGHMIGAQILFSGSISEYRDMYRMRVRAIAVETAEIVGTRTVNIRYDPTLTGLLGKINPADAWKHQWLYAGFSVGYSLQFNRNAMLDAGYKYYLNLPLAFSINLTVQPFDLFGIAVDFGGDAFEGPNASILPTLTIRPAGFEIDLFLGAGINVFNQEVAFLGGGRVGHKAGAGVLYAEVRPIAWLKEDIDVIPFHINFTLGYKIGFINRK